MFSTGGTNETLSEGHGQKKLRHMSKMLFDVMSVLDAESMLENVNGEVRKWYILEKHRREAIAESHRELNRKEELRKAVLARLTPEEREILGLDNPDALE